MLSKQKKRQIALARIRELFFQAELAFKKHPELSNRYIQLARRLSMKSKARIPSELKRRFCKHCYHFLVPGVNCRIRTRNKIAVYYCMDCRHYTRYRLR